MTQALTAFAIFIMVAGGVIVFLNRRTRDKMRETALDLQIEKKPRSFSKRQQRIVASLEPAKELPSIEQLVAEEAADTGVNDIPGGEGLDVSLKLRVYWRDEVVRQGCEDGHLEFRIDGNTTPETAATEDVRLVCVRGGVVQDEAATEPAEDETAQSEESTGDGATAG